jgi:hypothetical protein
MSRAAHRYHTSAAMRDVVACISIDCECDKGPGWRSQRPLRFAGITEGIGRRLAPLFAHYRAKPTYLISPEVLRDDASIATLRAQRHHAELGTHLHGEYAEPGAHEPDVTRAFQRDYPEAIERAKLASLTAMFRSALDHAPRSFRAGRFGIGAHTIPILEALEYRVESSVTPAQDWSSAGAPGLDFTTAPSQPYRPDPRRPGAPGASRLWEVPVTIRRRAWSRVPGLGRWIGGAWLRPTWGSAARLIAIARAEVRDARRSRPQRPIVLHAMFHNVEIIPGASPYADREADAQAILARLAALLAFAEREGIRVIGLGDVPEQLAEPRV